MTQITGILIAEIKEETIKEIARLMVKMDWNRRDEND